jgi:large subunit ribosomal protein L22
MTPTTPGDPQKGKVDEAKVEEEAKETKATAEEPGAQPEPKAKAKPKKAKAKSKAKPKPAAEETGVDKAAAAETEAKPKKAKVKPSERDPAGTKPEGTKAKSAAASAEGDVKKAAAKAPKKRDRRRRPEPGVLVRAQAKYVRTSARKARLVCDHIRGKDVAEARAILAYTPRAAAKAWIKLLESAIANAEHNHELVGEDLRIAAVHADEGPTLKRYRPRAMGRATRIRKRTSHLTITLTPKES